MRDKTNAPESKIFSKFPSLQRRVRSDTVAEENRTTAKETSDTSRGHKTLGLLLGLPSETSFPKRVNVLYCHTYTLASTCSESREREHYSALCRIHQHDLKFQQLWHFE